MSDIWIPRTKTIWVDVLGNPCRDEEEARQRNENLRVGAEEYFTRYRETAEFLMWNDSPGGIVSDALWSIETMEPCWSSRYDGEPQPNVRFARGRFRDVALWACAIEGFLHDGKFGKISPLGGEWSDYFEGFRYCETDVDLSDVL